jgi:hypothetical protein
MSNKRAAGETKEEDPLHPSAVGEEDDSLDYSRAQFVQTLDVVMAALTVADQARRTPREMRARRRQRTAHGAGSESTVSLEDAGWPSALSELVADQLFPRHLSLAVTLEVQADYGFGDSEFKPARLELSKRGALLGVALHSPYSALNGELIEFEEVEVGKWRNAELTLVIDGLRGRVYIRKRGLEEVLHFDDHELFAFFDFLKRTFWV